MRKRKVGFGPAGTLVAGAIVAALVVGSTGVGASADDQRGGAGGGETRVGVNVSEWLFGSGQPNGNFTVAERNGVQIGLRPVERYGNFALPLVRDGQTGVYAAQTGNCMRDPDCYGTSWWGYSVHVDLRRAQGVAAGRTVQDYAIVVNQDYWAGSLFGLAGLNTENYFDWAAKTSNFDFLGGYFTFTNPFDVATWGGTSTARLYQESWAPSFGTFGGFDTSVEGVYSIRLSLVPKTFNGAPLSVTVRVVVSHP
jgi:hypothetical protein